MFFFSKNLHFTEILWSFQALSDTNKHKKRTNYAFHFDVINFQSYRMVLCIYFVTFYQRNTGKDIIFPYKFLIIYLQKKKGDTKQFNVTINFTIFILKSNRFNKHCGSGFSR